MGELLDLGALRALKAETRGKIYSLIIPNYYLIIPSYKRQKWIDMAQYDL